MEHIELVLFGLLVAVAGLAVVARLVRIRDKGTITDEVRRRVEYDLAFEEARLSG